MKNVWGSERKSMATGTVKSLLNIKYNSQYSCSELYKIIQNNGKTVNKAASSEKYERHTTGPVSYTHLDVYKRQTLVIVI